MLKLEKAEYLGTNAYSFSAEGIVISETEYHKKVFEGWHCHENHHISLITRGGNREQRKHQEFEASPGTVVIYNSGELHRNINTVHPSKNINLEIESAFLNRYQLDFSSLTSGPDLNFTILKMYRESRINDACSVSSIQALLLNIFSTGMAQKTVKNTPPWISSLRSLIHDRWSDNLSLQELAEQINIHPVTISKYFPRYFSCTLGEYMRKIRIEKATGMMRQPDRALTDVAYQCGFSDQSHFIRTFKAVTGFLPKEYRKL